MNGLYGRCKACGHVFLVAKLPMAIEKAAVLASRAACAQCGETRNIGVAVPDRVKQEGGSE